MVEDLQNSLRRSLLVFDGDATGFVTRPISGVLVVLLVLVLAGPLLRRWLRRRAEQPTT